MSEALCPANMAWVHGDACVARRIPKAECPKPQPVGVCIDVFEYPNQAGVLPAVMLHFEDARRVCAAEGKRLCSDSEWTVACSGTENLTACNFGRTTQTVPVAEFWDPRRVSRTLAQHDGRRAARPSLCVSAHGVFDLLGNVQEWVVSEHPAGYEAALKGGRYNQSLIGCVRSVQVKHVLSRLPHTGFRCCSDPLVEPPGPP